MPEKTIHLICNAHLDPVWQWEWEEGAATAVSTFRTAADLCEEFDEFIFCHNEAILYRWVEEYEPELFHRIQKLVKAGKWHIMGGWYLQPDCNMPSGESIVRQILLGRSYFREKFGVEPRTAINLDPFGHSRGLVQILVKSGYDSYLICRPLPGDIPDMPDRFVWQGFDGSEVLVHRVADWYNAPLGKAREKVERRIGDPGDLPCNVVLWGVGNHGGGPSRKDLDDLRSLIAESADPKVVHSTPEAYFDELAKVRSSLHCRANDLNPWGVGCYTSMVRIKQKHRQLENELFAFERMACSAWLQGLMDYPHEELMSVQRDLATCQFHDILPGSSIQPVEEMSLRVLDHALEEISRLRARAFFALSSGQPPAKENEIPILVYNPHPFKVRTIVECEFQLEDIHWEEQFTVTPVYHNETPLPSQNEKELGNLGVDWRKRAVFLAELEPCQMNRFDARLVTLKEKPRPQIQPDGDRITLKTPDLEAAVSTKTGLLETYKAGGVDYITGGAFEPIVIRDSEDPWGMLSHSFRDVEGSFRLMSDEEGTKFSGVRAGILPSVRVIEDGDVRVVVEALLEYGRSVICQRYMLPKKGTEIEVHTRVYWNEKDRMLKLQVPVTGEGFRYLGQTAFGVQELPSNGDEAVAQKWTAVVTGDGRALTCINEGTYGSDFSEHGLRLTLLRSPAYAAHPIPDRPLVPQDRFTVRIDQGERQFRFWINAGSASERLEHIDREALVRNEKPFAMSFFPSGAGERPMPFVEIEDDVVLVSAVKPAEEGNGIVVRLYEPTGTPRKTVLKMPFCGLRHEVSLGAFEIKTLLVDPKEKTAVETDLLERKTG